MENIPKIESITELNCLQDATQAATWMALALACKDVAQFDVVIETIKERLKALKFDNETIESTMEFTMVIRAEMVKNQ